MVEQSLNWLTGLPPLALYFALAVFAAVENIFPPIPADTVVAFGAFLAARTEATPAGTFLATWFGNIAGAMLVYGAGRRLGADWLDKRLERFGGEKREERVRRIYERWGLLGLFLSRFLPGVRALVPPLAGALRIPAPRMTVVIAIASAIWYGVITILAYRVGSNWEVLQEKIGTVSRNTGIVAAAIVAVGLMVWFVVHRRRRSRAS
jgi:membrane protein DedA with SNARE-associated domain